MTKINVVRHPETIWNVRRLFQGSQEGSISEQGKQEAQKFVLHTKNIKIALIYYADNGRCKYLAERISKVHPKSKIIKDIRLNERSFGRLEGTYEVLAATKTNFNPDNYLEKFKWRPEGGESLEDVFPRVKDFIAMIKAEAKNETIFVVTSGGIMKLISFLSGINDLKGAMSYKAKNLEILNFSLE
jgi:broad specificity phosphatase PhoE